MKPRGVDPTNRPAPAGRLLSDPRLKDLDTARRHGYTDYHLSTIMGGLEAFERQLAHRFGTHLFDQVKFRGISFVTGDNRVGNAGIGLASGEEILVDPTLLPPATFIRRLIPYLAREYAYGLVLHPKVLWESLPNSGKRHAELYYLRVREEQKLDHLSDRRLARIFIKSLGPGLNNPYLDGLKTSEFDTGAIYDDTQSDELTDLFVIKAIELITERVTDLLVHKTPRFEAAIREEIAECAASLKEHGRKVGRSVLSAYAMHVRVFAEKTGNADLLHDLESENLGSLHTELCRVLSALWDQIELKPRR